MICGCIFDADGTLLDSMKIWDDLGERYLRSTGKKPEQDLNQILFPMTLTESSAYLQKHYLSSLSCTDIENGFLHLIAKSYEEEIPLKPGTGSLIHALYDKKIPMTVATTSNPSLIRSALKRCGILDCFMDVLDTESMHTDKEHPDIYLKACQIMHTSIPETAVFEDTLIPVKTAGKAGFPVVAIEDDASKKDRETIRHTADLYLHDFTETEKLRRWMEIKKNISL